VRATPGIEDVAVTGRRVVAVVAWSWWQVASAAGRLDVAWTPPQVDAGSTDTPSSRLHAALSTDTPHGHLDQGDGDPGRRRHGQRDRRRNRPPPA